jgi:ribosomal protein S21
MTTPSDFKVGDVVRVRAARRRDVVFTVRQVTASHLRAEHERGGQAFYPIEQFERVSPATAEPAPRSATGTDRHESFSLLPSAPAELRDSVVIVPYELESIESLLKRFKRASDRAGVVRECRNRQRFVPKSQQRRSKSRRARHRRGELSQVA